MKNKQIIFILCLIIFSILVMAYAQDSRDRYHQPDKVMDIAGVKPGMTIGEVGAGHGYFTFKLARRVGTEGKVYANDISRGALNSLRRRAEREGFSNIETVIGEVEDPLLPEGLDMVFIVNAFHDLARPVALLNNLSNSLKSTAKVVILDRDPAKVRDPVGHLLGREEIEAKVAESVFEMDRVETFLIHHNIYILKLNKTL